MNIRKTIDKDELYKMYVIDRLLVADIGDHFGVSDATLRRILRDHNIPKRKATTKYTQNDDYFSVPNIENSYFAGFLAADGCISPAKGRHTTVLAIRLSAKDIGHLENFGQLIQSTNTIRSHEVKISTNNVNNLKYKSSVYHQCVMQIYSEKICDDLTKNFNITPRKSLTLKPPVGLSDDQTIAFILGYIDGDGSVITKGDLRMSAIGTTEILEWMRNEIQRILRVDNPGTIAIIKSKNIVYRYYASARTVKALYTYGHALNVPWLERKWGKVEQFIKPIPPVE